MNARLPLVVLLAGGLLFGPVATVSAAWATPAHGMPNAVTLGDVPRPPDHEQVTAMHKHHRPPGKRMAEKRAKEMAELRTRIAQTPRSPEHVGRLHRLGELVHDEIHWRHFLRNRARHSALIQSTKERARIERKRKRYVFKVALSTRRNWRMPVKPDLTPKIVVPAETKMDVRPAIRRIEVIIKHHPHYKRMDAVLLLAGTMRIYQGLLDKDLSGVAVGRHYLKQLLHEFYDSPLAPQAGVRLADLALSRGDTVHAREYLEELAAEVRSGELHDYALYRLAWLKVDKNLATAVVELRRLARAAGDVVIKELAARDATALAKHLPRGSAMK
ncbi:MAG: hypothetical protein KC502_17635 [Myxococcales bacterium]|nr:hypothetical protein [Myxococcales bacterium]